MNSKTWLLGSLGAVLLAPSLASATVTASTPQPPPVGACPEGSTGVVIRATAANPNAVVDSVIWELFANYNAGNEGVLYTGDSGGEKRSLVRYDLASAVPYRSTIVQATGFIWISVGTPGQDVGIHRIVAPWAENTVTWNNFGGIDPTLAASFVTISAGWRSFDLTEITDGWSVNQYGNYGILFEQTDDPTRTSYTSSEYRMEFLHPALHVCYTGQTAAIGDTVYFDEDASATQDQNEPGLDGVAVELYSDAACDGIGDQVVATEITDAVGHYLFNRVEPGCYVVDVVESTVPAGFYLTTNNEPHAVYVEAGDEYLDADFGYTTNGSIGDTVWLDSDGDGLYEPEAGELGINGVTVSLVDANGNVVATTTTAASPTGGRGWYLFEDIAPVAWTIVVTPPAGLAATYDLDGLLDDQTTYQLAAGEDFLGADFGYIPDTLPGTGTPGYWMNHASAWPVDSIVLGSRTYTKAQAILIMKKPTKGDVTYIIAAHLIAAKLNVGIGNESSCVEAAIRAADAWLTLYPIGTNVKATSSAWTGAGAGEATKNTLDAYDNGLLCSPSRG